MKRLGVLLFCFALSGALSGLHAAEVAGVKVEDAIRAAGTELKLNGAGLRSKAFFRVYVVGIYLPEKKSAAADVIGAAGPKRVAIHMLRDVDAADFSEALDEGLRNNHSEADMKALAPRMAQLSAVMNELKEAKKGMQIALDWAPGGGTLIVVDGKPRGKPIEGEDFYRALLRIWLGERPISGDLKNALLGKAP